MFGDGESFRENDAIYVLVLRDEIENLNDQVKDTIVHEN